MGINIKYFVISITAIFLSLAIGIFVGFNMNGQDLYLKQQQSLIDSLEKNFNEFKKEKDNLEENIKNSTKENEKLSHFIESVFFELVHNKLLGINVAIIEANDNYFYDDIYNALSLAGANAPTRIRYTNRLHNISNVKLAEISQSFGVELETHDEFINLINNEVVKIFSNKEISDVLKFMIDEEYIIIEIDYDNIDELVFDSVIVSGGSTSNQKNNTTTLEVSLAKKMTELGLNVVGAERLDVEHSLIPELKKLGISTVDNINNKIGQTSLIYILAGTRGNFGEKDSAEALVPFSALDQR